MSRGFSCAAAAPLKVHPTRVPIDLGCSQGDRATAIRELRLALHPRRIQADPSPREVHRICQRRKQHGFDP
jgi:hypothetical protein